MTLTISSLAHDDIITQTHGLMDKIGDYLIIIVGVRKRVSIRENVDISWSQCMVSPDGLAPELG